MKRRAPALLAAAVIVGLGALIYRHNVTERSEARAEAAEKKDAEFKAATKAAEKEQTDKEKKEPLELLASAPEVPLDGSQFHLMPDGSPVPPLPTSAPEKVKLGIILFKYKGAEGAGDSTRSRTEAEALAKEAIAEAKTDFEGAVKKGDRGSSANVGWIGQRILERSVEYAVFSLDKDAITPEPVDTPRGFWVAKRIR